MSVTQTTEHKSNRRNGLRGKREGCVGVTNWLVDDECDCRETADEQLRTTCHSFHA